MTGAMTEVQGGTTWVTMFDGRAMVRMTVEDWLLALTTNYNRRLSIRQVAEIRRLSATGRYKASDLSRRFGVSKRTIQRVAARDVYSAVELADEQSLMEA